MNEEDKNIKSKNAEREEVVLKFWKENNIFQKSLKKDSPRGNYVFYDGPPFATGVPHYGHILGSTVKDVIGRYQTMKGYRVPRRWGWDCHGLPIENIVEKDLKISGKKAIEELGIDKFVEHARSKVLTYVSDWKKTIDRMGRWVDFDNSYKTMDNTFIESVWWALGELNNKGLLYEGVRVLAYCTRCETPIANSEIAMDNSYKDITDISVYVKFKITEASYFQISSRFTPKGPYTDKKSENIPPIYLLAWTTTPWTLPGNTAIAINKDITYLYVSNDGVNGKEILILAKEQFENLKNKFINPEIIKEVKGEELVGLSYEPIFDYYKEIDIPNKENIWKVWHADFVTIDKGTGIAHEAPAFGEDDMVLAKEHNIPFIKHVEINGVFSKEVTDFAGIKVKPKDDHQSTDVLVIKYLAHNNKLFAKEKIIHSYPHCYRCETPLIYYALPSWFVNIQKVKEKLLEDAKSINWIPSHLKDGRFKNIMEGAPDWTISRNRYWASPLPFWKSESGKIIFINGIEDLKSKVKKSGNKYFVMRHGESECNVSETIMGREESHNCKLTEKGKEQVKESSKNIKEKFDLIVASPFERTKETAKIICDQIGFPFDEVIFSDLEREWETSSLFTGKMRKDFNDYYCDKYKDHAFEVLPDSESYADLIHRVGKFIYELESKYSDKNILLVGHAGETSALQHIAQGFSFETLPTDNNFPPYLNNAEVRKLDFVPLPHNHNYELDLHRPYIDSIILVDEKGEEYHRVPEVIDCWFESGSMPFAQDHFPFENKDWKEKNFPSGFVAEYIAQTRTWFYYTHAISSILFGQAPFENVVTTGTILAEDGQKMSKSKNNFPDPLIIADKYGVDALRFYLLSSPLLKGEDINFAEKGVGDVASKIIGRFDNVLNFYELYRDKDVEEKAFEVKDNILDKWIKARLLQTIEEVSNGLDSYDLIQATRPFDLFIEDLSTWYLRRSRDRIKDGDKEAKHTLYYVLKFTSYLFAPVMPFIAEDVWQKLKVPSDLESVHLTDFFNEVQVSDIDHNVIKDMKKVREIVSFGLQARQKVGIPVRQPLLSLTVKNYDLNKEYTAIIRDELNVKMIMTDPNMQEEVRLNTEITEELRQEGQYRELVRALQDMRKKKGLNPLDMIILQIEAGLAEQEIINKFREELMKTVGVKEIKFIETEGEEVKIGELVFKINF